MFMFYTPLQPIDPPENSDAAALKMALELPYSDDDPAIMESFYRHSLSYMALQNDEDRAQWVGQLRLSSVSDLIRAVEFLRTYDGGISCTLEQQHYYEILNFVFGCDLDVEPDDCFMLITAYDRGVNLVFLKEPHINTDTYKAALDQNIALTGSNVDYILEGVNRYLMALAAEQIRLAFAQSEKEVQDLHQRTREGIVTAKLNGKQIGQPFFIEYLLDFFFVLC